MYNKWFQLYTTVHGMDKVCKYHTGVMLNRKAKVDLIRFGEKNRLLLSGRE
jgi:hypothetical protein